VRVSATLVLDGRPYDLHATAQIPPTLPDLAPSLAELGDVPIALGLVVAAAALDRAEHAALGPGDAWLAGAGWWINRELCGRAVLAAPDAENGISVELLPGGGMVVRGRERIALEVDTMSEEMSEAVGDAALDAPLVVRVELGSVSMTAREWARLRPGDVIEIGQRIAEPVTLRIAGRAVARGELVDVEGELGVRVRELVSAGEGA
jgi:type III secretion system YscQ/HrcQ family protein